MPPAPDLSLPGYVLAHDQMMTTVTLALPDSIFIAGIKIKGYTHTVSAPVAVQTRTLTPTSNPLYSDSVNWNSGVKFGLFLVGAFICLMLSFIVLSSSRKFRHEIRSKRAAKQRIRETEDRRRQVALQWQRLELDRHVQDASTWEMHQRTRYAEPVEKSGIPQFCSTFLVGDDPVQAREPCNRRVEDLPEPSQVADEDEGEREKAKEFNEARDTKFAIGEDEAEVSEEVEPHCHDVSAIETSRSSGVGKIFDASQFSSRIEFEGNHSTPLSSDEVLSAVNALGYESISDNQRAKARARALKDLEGR